MARQRKLIYGATTIDLLNTSGWIPPRAGAGDATLPEGTILGEYEEIPERHVLNLYQTSTDNLAAKIVELVSVLRAAARHARNPDEQPTPVYLIDQLTGETNPRYALVTGALEITHPELLTIGVELDHHIEKNGVTIVRRHPWISGVPGTLPTAKTLTATDGPASPTRVHVANFRDANAITHVYAYDTSAGTYSANLIAGNADLFPAAPAAGDMLLIGSTDGPFHHAVLNLSQAAAFACGVVVGYVTAVGPPPTVTALAAGSQFTLFPNGDQDAIFKSTGDWVVSAKPPNTWAAVTLNSAACWWIAVKLNTFTSFTTQPHQTTGVAIYAQKKNYIDIPASAFAGDMPPTCLMEMATPWGSTTAPGMGAVSKVIAGARSEGLGTFDAALNWGGYDNPTDWALATGTDATQVADPESPGGYCLSIDFATNSSMVVRGSLTGTGKAASWRGSFRPYITLKQIGGSPGDIRVKLRTCLGSTNDEDPKLDLPQTGSATESADLGYEIRDLAPDEVLRIPFGTMSPNDSLAVNLIFQLMAERLAGAATLRVGMLFLQPLYEPWSGQLDDPVTNRTLGVSALRGYSVLHLDGGVLARRCTKFAGSTSFPAQDWEGGPPLRFEPGVATRVYFLLGHYPTTWGDGPLLASLGMGFAFRLYGLSAYSILRGAA